MGHTVTNRKRATEALRSPLDSWAGWRLAVECGGAGCATGRAYDVAQLCRSYPSHSVYDAVARMATKTCFIVDGVTQGQSGRGILCCKGGNLPVL
jgi:hypothetical protein